MGERRGFREELHLSRPAAELLPDPRNTTVSTGILYRYLGVYVCDYYKVNVVCYDVVLDVNEL